MREKEGQESRAFVLTTTHVYVPGTLPKPEKDAPGTQAGACRGATPNISEAPARNASGCDKTPTDQQPTRCC